MIELLIREAGAFAILLGSVLLVAAGIMIRRGGK